MSNSVIMDSFTLDLPALWKGLRDLVLCCPWQPEWTEHSPTCLVMASSWKRCGHVTLINLTSGKQWRDGVGMLMNPQPNLDDDSSLLMIASENYSYNLVRPNWSKHIQLFLSMKVIHQEIAVNWHCFYPSLHPPTSRERIRFSSIRQKRVGLFEE